MRQGPDAKRCHHTKIVPHQHKRVHVVYVLLVRTVGGVIRGQKAGTNVRQVRHLFIVGPVGWPVL